MVPSMMSQTTLPKSFWDYALESATRILNMVPTKKVDKTPYENKVFVARKAEFPENSLIAQEASRSLKDLEIIQEEGTNPSIDSSLHNEEDDQEIDEPQSDINPIRCPQGHAVPQIDCVYKSMLRNMIWELVDLPPNGKTVGHKCLFKKKTDMDGAVHTYKACLVLKGFTQTPRIDYEETLSPGVDIRDILIMENNIPMLQDVKSYLGRCFAMKDLGEAAYILGIKIYQDRSKWLIGLCQSAYIEKILKRYFMENSKRGTIPMQKKLKLSKSQGEFHWTTLKNILKYLRNTKDMFLIYEGDTKRELRVSCYTDAGYLTDADDLNVFILNGGFVDWKSINQSIFATSSTDAKYIATFDASKEAVWIRKFITGLGVVPTI
ncbi:retrotransposon protein, putative, ty1-copia subclass [Tanacetum coccineum]